MNARTTNHLKHFARCQVTCVNASVSLAKKTRTPLICFVIALLAGYRLSALLRREIGPPIWSVISACLPLPVAPATLVGKAERAAFIFEKVIRYGRENRFATMALSLGACIVWVCIHVPIMQYGPHFELDRKAYP